MRRVDLSPDEPINDRPLERWGDCLEWQLAVLYLDNPVMLVTMEGKLENLGANSMMLEGNQ